METVRLLLALAAHGGLEVHHMDVKSAFLNGDLREQVYVYQPPGQGAQTEQGSVWASSGTTAWNARLDQEQIELGFRRSVLDHDSFLLVGVYVGDLIICGPNVGGINKFKQQMMKSFKMSDLDLLSYCLSIKVEQKKREIAISQSAYTGMILKMARMIGCNSCTTPMEPRLQLTKETAGAPVDTTKYRSIIGSLRYLVNTRPDIAFVVGLVSRFMEYE
ncbi:hypothetical protein U9M48_031646 [Paspalum notatum var. saurae]|uniref:Reverse transcriptase Ty1/copia-type domain-containing protein n=1 Tax=Paspalum notatum var. saurae TaxID=547442 RepID=A0AAQ3U5M4_PASNO